MRWVNRYRPGFFGSRRDEIVAGLNKEFGKDGWRLRHLVFDTLSNQMREYDYVEACKELYEKSYYIFLLKNPQIVDVLVRYTDVYDNATTNVQSGLDYTKQEAYSTHIQDIAIRNALKLLGREFTGVLKTLAQIRGPGSVGFQLGLNPGQVPYMNPPGITQPSLRPKWAQEGSVEDLWQSNKWVQIQAEEPA